MAAVPAARSGLKKLARRLPHWTPELAIPPRERAGGGQVDGIAGEGTSALDATRGAAEAADHVEIAISTLPRRVSAWLRRDLAHRVEQLGLPVTVVTSDRERIGDSVPAGMPGPGA